MSIAKKILLDELDEQIHPENVEDVIFWSLKYYSENYPINSLGKVVANYIVGRILEEEGKHSARNN